MTEPQLHYTFTCPSCSGNYSILLERIPPVQARFRCPHCQQPMDFPSRDEARVYARLQAETSAPAVAAASPPPPARAPAEEKPRKPPVWTPPAAGSLPPDSPENASQRLRVEKEGFETDIFDRRSIRNLIRTGEVDESDFVSVDDGPSMPAGEVPFLKSLFKLRATSTVMPPARCRTHTDALAFYKCQQTARPLCEECAPEKKFGNSTIRVCGHCGGNTEELAPPA